MIRIFPINVTKIDGEMSWFEGVRALDLTDEKGSLCGQILAKLGVEVIKIERPGGDQLRNSPPFYQDIPSPERSLNWFALNLGKKGITLNLTHHQGQDIFKRLVKTADFIIESFPPCYLDTIGLSYSSLSQINPMIIMTSITPFGQSGPYRDYEASDLTLMAEGGIMALLGEEKRPPLRLGSDQSYCLASAHAAVGTLLAYYYRQKTGEGQWVDVSILECLVRLNFRDPIRWEFDRSFSKRMGSRDVIGKIPRTIIWQCQDGYVTMAMLGGLHGAKENRDLVEWMIEEGEDVGELSRIKWEEVDMSKVPPQRLESWEKVFARFFLRHTWKEVEEGSRKRRLTIAGLRDLPGVLANEQLSARGFWWRIEHPELKETFTYPGYFFLSSEVNSPQLNRAPLIGEHNEEIYRGELGFTPEEISSLTEANVI